MIETSITATAPADQSMYSRSTFCASALPAASRAPTAEPEATARATKSTGMIGVFHTGRDWCTDRSKQIGRAHV